MEHYVQNEPGQHEAVLEKDKFYFQGYLYYTAISKKYLSYTRLPQEFKNTQQQMGGDDKYTVYTLK